MRALTLLLLLLCACGSTSTSSVDDVLATLSDREIFPMSNEEATRLLAPIGGACRGTVRNDGLAISCDAQSNEAAVAMMREWLARFETELDPQTLTADERRNGSLLRARVEGRRATIEFLHDPGLDGLVHD